MMLRTLVVRALLIAACAPGIAAAAAGDAYPVRPIRLLIPFPAGGAADLIGRTLGDKLSAQLGQPFVMDNRPGAGGSLATELLAKAEPDGYTLMVGMAGPVSISPSVNRHLPYRPERDLTPLTRVSETLNVVVVNPVIGVSDIRSFVDWARKHAGSVQYGTSGVGQFDHLAGEFFKRLAGIEMTQVPYKGNGPALVDLVAGQIQITFPPYIVAGSYVKAGRLRALAVTTAERQPLLPSLPTVAEALPGFALSNWNGMFGPARLPPAVADRLHAEINAALKQPDVVDRFHQNGMEPVGSSTRTDFAAFVAHDTAHWARIVKDANLKFD
ncbi:MAG TPA: tripartite tricarboxylate transporter substrate binding protein [Burkholderiales bacterium]|nr:tripartite tricarboxylate transporter substrate binding protein [Burkholderiales bacterium]